MLIVLIFCSLFCLCALFQNCLQITESLHALIHCENYFQHSDNIFLPYILLIFIGWLWSQETPGTYTMCPCFFSVFLLNMVSTTFLFSKQQAAVTWPVLTGLVKDHRQPGSSPYVLWEISWSLRCFSYRGLSRKGSSLASRRCNQAKPAYGKCFCCYLFFSLFLHSFYSTYVIKQFSKYVITMSAWGRNAERNQDTTA